MLTVALTVLAGRLLAVGIGRGVCCFNRLIARSRENADQIVMATANGKRGNPVLWPSRFFDELKNVVGDVGARHIIGANADRVTEIELGEAAGLDIDTPTTLQVIAASPDS